MTAPFFDFKLEGAKELDKVLAGLSKSMAKQQIKAGLRKAAKPVLKDARAMAPKKTGAMAKSIKVRTMVRTNVPAISIGPDAEHYYGVFTERGTAHHSAQPFLRPAWDKNKRQVRDRFVKNIWYVLLRAANRLKKQAYAGKLSNAGRKALGL